LIVYGHHEIDLRRLTDNLRGVAAKRCGWANQGVGKVRRVVWCSLGDEAER
jgi:hypothetical protein